MTRRQKTAVEVHDLKNMIKNLIKPPSEVLLERSPTDGWLNRQQASK